MGRAVVVGAIVFGSAAHSAVAYFGTWGRSSALYYAYDQGLWEIGQYVRNLPADEQVLLSPRPASDMTLAFAWREGPPVRHFDGRHAFVATRSDGNAGTYVIIEHEDFRGWRVLQDLYPGAVVTRTFLDRDGIPYARAYRLPPHSLPARSPRFPVEGHWPGLELVGYDLGPTSYKPGEVIYLQLWWRATAPITVDWTVFTHVLGKPRADGSILWTGHDARPGNGSIPMTSWIVGDVILDEHQLHLPPDMPAGNYQIEVGLYDLEHGGARSLLIDQPGMDHLLLATVAVE